MPDYKPLILYRDRPFNGSFTMTGPFGATHSPWSDDRPHLGVDYGCPAGTPILSTCFGKIVELQVHGGDFGEYALIDCTTKDGEPTEWYMLHAHLRQRDVPLGHKVVPGDRLGLSGFTGKVDPPGPGGAHLHWQMCRNNRAFPRDLSIMKDPLSFPVEELTASQIASMSQDEFFSGVCRGLGLEPTPWRLAVFEFWAGQEHHEGTLFKVGFNPLATTQPGDLNLSFDNGNGPGHWNSVPVKVYASPAAGIRATVETLTNGHYPNILRCLKDQVGYPEAIKPKDFTTWVGEEAYGKRVVDFMNKTKASKGTPASGALSEADVRRIAREEAVAVFGEMNGVLQQRLALERLAQTSDSVLIERAIELLRREGIV